MLEKYYAKEGVAKELIFKISIIIHPMIIIMLYNVH